MFQPSKQPVSSALVPVDANETYIDAQGNVQSGGFIQAGSIIRNSQKLQDGLQVLGMKIKQHEDNLNLLNTQKTKLDDSILGLQDIFEKYKSSSMPKNCKTDNLQPTSEEAINEQILQHEKSAAGLLCHLKTHHGTQASNLSWTKDVVGIVATLGKVEDDNLSRLFSEYLGVETMLAIVCRTYEGAKALEIYNSDGCIDKSSGLHGLGASIGRALNGRFIVMCLESLRPYAGKFVLDDPQKRLDILNPRLPNGECPAGFLGFAVNMINIDGSNLFCVTPSGYGLRETLFHNLFSRLQVYQTRAEMMKALPCISDGAVSLDGGMIRTNGVFSLGNREDVDVKFPSPVEFDSYNEIERQMRVLKGEKDKILGDMKREQSLMDAAKFSFNKKKNEFLKFLAESSSYATQVNASVMPLN
ncbi:protein DEFECTIVE IN MERISTEM SILENCING 3-like isoform X1 [Neltuma alba]|uniref:protein DEFECTIVE IN MERISTEM SILENCING 3-like isoform X1 n=1 Tax=Neltuma alba TaxID=207710 RepID=UPI0010A3D208|nr:protein DEFECTIVE IN MERISTEM SILENCING 3-like isoform X1 [Prosopis alba]